MAGQVRGLPLKRRNKKKQINLKFRIFSCKPFLFLNPSFSLHGSEGQSFVLEGDFVVKIFQQTVRAALRLWTFIEISDDKESIELKS